MQNKEHFLRWIKRINYLLQEVPLAQGIHLALEVQLVPEIMFIRIKLERKYKVV